jgi:predicted nucleic acid-binding Zn ribbon protein
MPNHNTLPFPNGRTGVIDDEFKEFRPKTTYLAGATKFVLPLLTAHSASPKVDRRGLKCKVCGEPVVYPRYYYCSDECKALKRPERQRVNSREYRKRKREEAEQQQEARRARSRRQDSDKL